MTEKEAIETKLLSTTEFCLMLMILLCISIFALAQTPACAVEERSTTKTDMTSALRARFLSSHEMQQ
jgi:hypothetical protein